LQTSGLKRSDNTFSWSLGALQPLTDTLNLYANIGQAYRSPDMRERFEDAERGDGYFHIGNPQLKAERSTSYELGLKGRDGQQNYQLAAFYTRLDDYIAGRITGEKNPPNNQPVKRTENLDKVIIYGLEGNLEQPVGDFIVDAGFTWLRGKNKQDNEPLYQTPASELRLGIGQPAELGFSWHTGLRAVASQNRIAKKFSNNTEDKTSGFVTADINLGYGFGSMAGLKSSRVDLQLSNLTNKKYHEHLTDGISGYELKAPGRGVTLGVSGSF
ncbi:MAG: TonB-dependent receptor, partial [Thiopseudomonas sp.]